MRQGGRMIFVLLYVLATAIGNLILHLIGIDMPLMLLIFLSSSYAIIFFNFINLPQLTQVYVQLFKLKLLYLLLSIFMVLMWLGSFLVPIYFLPSIYLISFMSIVATLGALALFYEQKSRINLLKFFVLLINLLLFYVVSSFYYTSWKFIAMVSICLISGISGYGYLRTSGVFNKHNFTASQLLMVRFWSLWLVSLVAVLYMHYLGSISAKYLLDGLIVAVLTLIVPLYYVQKAVEKIGANLTSLWMGFTPFITFIGEKIMLRDNFGYTGYFALSLTIILSVFYTIHHYQSKQINAANSKSGA